MFGQVVPGLVRHRHESVVLDFDDFTPVEVVDEDKALGGMGIGVVVGVVAHVHQCPYQPTTLIVSAVVSSRPRFDADQVEIGHAAPGERVQHAAIALAVDLAFVEFVEHDRRL